MLAVSGTGQALAGRRGRQKILPAVALSAVIPLGILGYVLLAHVLPLLDPVRHRGTVLALQGLIVLTGILIVVGAYVLWDLTGAVARTAESAKGGGPLQALEGRTDEIGVLMQSFSRMIGTIESQAQEINGFAGRLDAAYKELERTNSRLKEFSFKDEVTGLYNRRFFSIRLEEEVSRHRRFRHPVSVVLLDLDGFKAVNDQQGHAAGDDTLRDVAQILLKHSRGINVISRYGGDEFVVLLVETSKPGARLYADRIRQVVAKYPFNHGLRVTASFGISSLPEDVEPSAEEMMRAADEALYGAKRAGKNTVTGYDTLLAPTEAPEGASTATPRTER